MQKTFLRKESKSKLNQLNDQSKLFEENKVGLELLLNNSNDIYVLVNKNKEQFFISESAENLTGYSVKELLGGVENVIYPEDLEIVRQHLNRVFDDKSAVDCIQYRHKHKEKGYVWFEAIARNCFDNPALKAIVANIRDISERKKAEDLQKKSETEKIELISLEIESKEKTITSSSLKLIQKCECEALIIKKLVEIEKNTNGDSKQKINNIIANYQQKSNSSQWAEFEILFEKVQYSFYKKLNTRFPDLTANDRKICAFLKLNMSNKSIAQITFQSEDALKKARTRLRKKFGICRQTNLTVFLQNI